MSDLGIILMIICAVSALNEVDPRNGIYLIEGQIVKVTADYTIEDDNNMFIKPCLGKCSENIDAVKLTIFDPAVVLARVVRLLVKDILWPPFPEGQYMNNLATVQFYNVTPRDGFGACPQLENLEIYSGDFSMISSDWLRNCTNLRFLYARVLNVMQIHTVIRSAVYVEHMIMENLQNIGEWAYLVKNPIFSNSSNLMKITIESYYSLELKNASWAEISAGMLWQFSMLPRLQELLIYLDGFDMCAGGYSPVTLRSLRSLVLGDNTTNVCFSHYRKLPKLESLTYGCLALQECRRITIKFKVVEVFSSRGQNMNVTVFNRHVNFIFELSQDDFLMLSSEPKKNVAIHQSKRPVACYCSDMFWLARAVKLGYITTSALDCRNGLDCAQFSFSRMKRESMQCKSECLCYLIGPDEEIIADCRGINVTQLPTTLLGIPNLTEVYAPNSSITSLPKTLPATLRFVDVSCNKIRNIHGGLLAERSRRWRLAGNPLTCACDNHMLLDTLQFQKHQIEDLQNVNCVNGTFEKSLVALLDFCRSLELNKTLASKNLDAKLAKDREETLVISVTVVAIVAIVVSITGLVFYYRRPIQILLFARGWCLSWLKDEDLDEDRPYDVFLSFCHADAELVLGQLLPTLEQEYSICVHLRDWMPGEMIPTQIGKSVQVSKRTLIFLTKNFAESLWGMLEFQTAYASGLEEKRIRVVMVVVDDVLESPSLNKDIREYVRFNTYVRWDDPWFWSKLRYALPHRKTLFQPIQNRPARYMVPNLAEAPQ